YGGGTSVVGGVTPRIPPSSKGAVSIDLGALDQLLELDPVSRAARIQGGAAGPHLEAQLAEHGMTLRHFPQSFELSTLGGWIATRAGGHFAPLRPPLADFVECRRRLSQSGPDPANCRLIDAREARVMMAGDGSRDLLVLGFESTDHPVDAAMDRALEICAAQGGVVEERGARGSGRERAGGDAVSSWRQAFLGAPYM